MLKQTVLQGSIAGLEPAGGQEASSTERLLQVIRSQEGPLAKAGQPLPPPGTAAAGPAAAEPTPAPARRERGFSLPWASGSGLSLGVELAQAEMRLALASRDGSRVILAESVPYPAGVSPAAPEFWSFLRDTLHAKAGSHKNLEVWTTLAANRADIWSFRTPVVASRELTNAVYWSAKRERQFDESQVVFDFEVHGEVRDKDQPRLSVTAYSAPRAEVQGLTDLFRKAGFPLKGIVPQSFAVQSLCRASHLEFHDECFGSLHIGPEWTRIDVYLNRSLILSREFKTGFNTVQDALLAEYNARQSTARGLAWPKGADAPEAGGRPQVMTSADAATLLEYFAGIGPALAEGMPGAELDASAVVQLSRDALERLARQIERTFAHVNATHGAPVQGFCMSGALGGRPELLRFFGDQVGLPASRLNPLAGHDLSGTPFGQDAPADARPALAVALGLALSRAGAAPNLLHTYRDRQLAAQGDNIVRLTLAACLAMILAVAGFAWWVDLRAAGVRAEAEQVSQQLTMSGPLVEPQAINELAAQVVKGAEGHREYGRRLHVVGLIGELVRLTPEGVRLLSVRMTDSGQPPKGKEGLRGYQFIVDGIVVGDPALAETAMTGFLAQLGGSALFAKPAITKNEAESFGPEGRVQHFIITLSSI